MSEPNEERPSPEALLVEAAQEERGQLKIFLGAAPGVGKTYAMLSAAHQRLNSGVDVVIGVVETHGRRETLALTYRLEAVPLKRITYRGRSFPEMDLEAILKRKPKLVLVDELAHTNIPGSRHAKRYQDVEELLAAGIDVYTTLNIQHLDSLNDIVERISRIKVRETVPDRVLEQATDIELIDLSPDELLQRLREGKVYVPREAQRAIGHFFSRGNLTALREMAMRAAAERIDADMLNYMRARAISGPWPTRERLLVCIDNNSIAERLIRTGRRIAERREIPWIVVHVERIGTEDRTPEQLEQLNTYYRLAEELGATVEILQATNAADELLRYAREQNVNHLILGRPVSARLWYRLRRPLSYRLLRYATDFEITWIGPGGNKPSLQPGPHLLEALRRARQARYLESTGAVLIATGIAYLLSQYLVTADLSMVFLTAVILLAGRWGLWTGLYTSLLSFVAFNFFFTRPYYTFSVIDRQDLLTLVFFLFVSVICGNLAARVRSQMEAIRKNAQRTSRLYDLSRRLGGAVGRNDLVWTISEYLTESLDCQAIVVLPSDENTLEVAAGEVGRDDLIDIDWAAASWAQAHNADAGWTTGTLPGSRWLFLPLPLSEDSRGVIGITFKNRQRDLDPQTRRLLDAMKNQAAIALSRAELMEQQERREVEQESDKLRAALLSSISHDLRTPLVSILGAATSLLNYGDGLAENKRQELLDTVIQEAERMNRFVQNLLDMTRLSYGALHISRQWCDLREVVAAAAKRLHGILQAHPLSIEISEDCAQANADATLLEQVFVNLLDNAAKYSPDKTPIKIRAHIERDELVVDVVDRGVGIALEDRGRVFDMFQRVKDKDSRTAGTGLGLGIARALVEAHGGVLRARAGDEGVGTRMEIVLPRTTPPQIAIKE